MKKQDVSITLLKTISSLRKKIGLNKITKPIIFSISLLLSYNLQANQSVFLDANGVPISDEVLLMLSTGTSPKTKQKQASKQVTSKRSAETAKSNSGIKLIKRKRVANPKLEEEMLYALKAGNVPRVEQLLRSGISPTFKNYKGETPLGIAVSRGWASMVIKLIQNGADINEKGARGVTLLHVASAKGLTDVAKVLVRGGLNPSQKTDKNWTPLHVAARYNHWKLVQYYVSAGVDPDIRNSDGQTALGLARHLRHKSIIKILSRVTRRSSLDFAEVNLLKNKKKKRKRSKKRKKRKSKK